MLPDLLPGGQCHKSKAPLEDVPEVPRQGEGLFLTNVLRYMQTKETELSDCITHWEVGITRALTNWPLTA